MKKKIICLLCVILLTALCMAPLSSCNAKKEDRLQVVCTIFPIYDWVINIVGERTDRVCVTLLQDSGADLHSYQPTIADLAAIAESDVFLYVGGESDDWVADALRSVKKKKAVSIDLLSLLGNKALVEEIVEGMEHEEKEEDSGEQEEEEYDEHVWLSLKNAAYFVRKIAEALGNADEEGADVYAANATAYESSLNALDLAYAQAVEAAPRDTLLFGDRFPFRYLLSDYDLRYYAAFVGCSAEISASIETTVFLAKKIDELGIKVILRLENSNEDMAKGIRNATNSKNQSIMVLDSIQSATKKEYKNGRNYLSIMESNLEVLKTALAA